MSSTPGELLGCAQAIAADASTEASFRSAISRAYYASFHAATDFHNALPKPGSNAGASGAHEILIKQLYYPGVDAADPNYAKSKTFGKLLNQLKIFRVVADYKLDQLVEKHQMDTALASSAALVTAK